jgi:phosphoesterase RecJ-like protein
VDTDAASTCEMIVKMAGTYKVAIDREMASIAYAGILYDTGSFIYPKTSARTFKAALDLVKAGAVPNEIYRNMFESASVGALLLQKRVLSSLDLRASNRIALQTLTKQDLESSGAAYEDAESLINIPLKSKEIEVSILVKENEDGRIRCSLRSKGRVNVSAIAQTFGGGGHRTAAGFKSRQGLAETKEEVLKKVISALEME